ncbi:hypothetical protein PILCRDRAFT_92899 [Piloderma croceum F 1598]|uniref:DUF4219 domain-containing protein n=1 Tax=Piloderma croceum (strain F 1598) TaxID=765440 RepID=A0A0C3F0T1_PILCF|nr:hypothetical protein PILCRDRAFT_92899 [Piloderma croceum F 1598]
MSSNKTILALITKLNGQNWHTWSKETKAYPIMEEFWGLVDPTEGAPTTAANLKQDKKDTIMVIKLGQEAWTALKAEHEKDTPSTCMNLHQCFYTLSHDPAVGVIPFINEVLTIV